MPAGSHEYIKRAVEAQGFTKLLGAEVDDIGEGYLVLSLRFRAELTQQNGFFHGGAIAYLIDNATTAAAATVLRPGQSVLTAEYKLNLLSPGIGDRLVCRAEVLKPGRLLSVVEAKVYAEREGKAKLVTTALATIANLANERDQEAAVSSEPAA